MKPCINKLFCNHASTRSTGQPWAIRASLGNSELSQSTVSECFTLQDASLGHSIQLQDILGSLGDSGQPCATCAYGCMQKCQHLTAPRPFSVIVFNQCIKEKHEIPILPSHLLSNVEYYHCSCYGIGDMLLGSALVVDPGTF